MTDLLETTEDGIAWLTLNRPDRLNALSPAMLSGLGEALHRLSTDPTVGAMVITGAGRGFCAGGDGQDDGRTRYSGVRGARRGAAPDASAPVADPHDAKGRHRYGQRAGGRRRAGVGDGLRPANRRILGPIRHRFCRGRLFRRLRRLLDPDPACRHGQGARALFSWRYGDSATALSLGLVSRVVDDEALRNKTAALARRIADGPRIAYGYMKRNLFAAETEPLAAVLELEALHQARTAMTEDHLEASRAFVEKRRPVFKGR